MPVHGPTALQAKLKLEGRSVLTFGSLSVDEGRWSVGAVMLTSLVPGARQDGHRSSLQRLRHYSMSTHTMAAEPLTKSSPAQAACVSTAAPPKRYIEKVGFLGVL